MVDLLGNKTMVSQFIKRGVFLLLITLVIVHHSSAEQRAINAATIHIGVALPLTGDLEQYGAAVRNGIEIAQKKYKNEFKNIELHFEDNRYDAVSALKIFQKFQSQNVNLVYSWGEVPLGAIAPVAERAKIPLLAMSMDVHPALHQRYIIRTANDPVELVRPLAETLRKRNVT